MVLEVNLHRGFLNRNEKNDGWMERGLPGFTRRKRCGIARIMRPTTDRGVLIRPVPAVMICGVVQGTERRSREEQKIEDADRN